MNATLTVTGTIDDIIAFADLLRIGRGVMIDAAPDPNKLTLAEVDYVRSGNIIMAIKEVRTRTGMDLKQAKDLVDNSPERRDYLAANPPPPPPQRAPIPTPRQPADWDDDWAAKRTADAIPF